MRQHMFIQSLLLTVASSTFLHSSEQQIIQHAASSPDGALHKLPGSPIYTFHRALTNIESITGHEQEAGAYLSSYLSEDLGLHITKIPVPKDPSRFSILAYPGPKLPSILFSSHYDTVPPFYPYAYNETTGVISGRGSVDAKAAVAAQTIALSELLHHDRDANSKIGLLFVVGEEVDGIGMKSSSAWLQERNITFDAVIFGEPTEAKLVCGHKGITMLSIIARGKAAHSGYPWLGLSANAMIIRALAAIEEIASNAGFGKNEKYGATTVNFGRIEGGVAGNVVPAEAVANITVRIAEGTPKDIQQKMWSAANNATEALRREGGVLEMDVSSNGYPPVDMDCTVDGFDTTTVNYGTDVPNLEGPHRRFLYGPGTIFVAHSDHEALHAEELSSAVRKYKELATAALHS